MDSNDNACPEELVRSFRVGVELGVIQFGPVGPTVVNKSVQKFTLFANNRATLVSASTNLPGKLVLESVGCAPFA
jgi:hypothetical protein